MTVNETPFHPPSPAVFQSKFIKQTAVTTLEKLHAKHVLPGFADRSAEERDIESLTTDITRVCLCLLLSFQLSVSLSFPTRRDPLNPTLLRRTSVDASHSFKAYRPPLRTGMHSLQTRPRPRGMNVWPHRTCSAVSPPRSRISAQRSGRNSVYTSTVSSSSSARVPVRLSFGCSVRSSLQQN